VKFHAISTICYKWTLVFFTQTTSVWCPSTTFESHGAC